MHGNLPGADKQETSLDDRERKIRCIAHGIMVMDCPMGEQMTWRNVQEQWEAGTGMVKVRRGNF
jgi:hypothetical protein